MRVGAGVGVGGGQEGGSGAVGVSAGVGSEEGVRLAGAGWAVRHWLREWVGCLWVGAECWPGGGRTMRVAGERGGRARGAGAEW